MDVVFSQHLLEQARCRLGRSISEAEARRAARRCNEKLLNMAGTGTGRAIATRCCESANIPACELFIRWTGHAAYRLVLKYLPEAA